MKNMVLGDKSKASDGQQLCMNESESERELANDRATERQTNICSRPSLVNNNNRIQ